MRSTGVRHGSASGGTAPLKLLYRCAFHSLGCFAFGGVAPNSLFVSVLNIVPRNNLQWVVNDNDSSVRTRNMCSISFSFLLLSCA